MFPRLAAGTDGGLLLMRLIAALIFGASGWKHLQDPAGRGQDIGMSRGFTIFLGGAELAGALGIAFGVLTQLAAIGLILIMLGAIQKKAMVWKTGFWGTKTGTEGWHYDLMLVVMCLLIALTDGGRYTLLH